MLKIKIIQGQTFYFEDQLESAMEQGWEPLMSTKNTIFNESNGMFYHSIMCQRWEAD